MKQLKDLKPGEIFWTYTDDNVIQFQFLGKLSTHTIWGHHFLLTKEIVTGKEVYMSEINKVFTTEEEAIKTQLNTIRQEREKYNKQKELIEKDITKCNNLIYKYTTQLSEIQNNKIKPKFKIGQTIRRDDGHSMKYTIIDIVDGKYVFENEQFRAKISDQDNWITEEEFQSKQGYYFKARWNMHPALDNY